MGLTLSKVPAVVVTNAGKSPGVDSAGECDLQRWQPDWVAISYAHKRIDIIDLCRPSDVHEDQLEVAAATRKLGGYSPLLRALDFNTKQGRVMHVTCLSVGGRDPWVVASSSHICPAAILGGPT
jgi:hypothetical protein